MSKLYSRFVEQSFESWTVCHTHSVYVYHHCMCLCSLCVTELAPIVFDCTLAQYLMWLWFVWFSNFRQANSGQDCTFSVRCQLSFWPNNIAIGQPNKNKAPKKHRLHTPISGNDISLEPFQILLLAEQQLVCCGGVNIERENNSNTRREKEHRTYTVAIRWTLDGRTHTHTQTFIYRATTIHMIYRQSPVIR